MMKIEIGGFRWVRAAALVIIPIVALSGCPAQIITLVIPGDFTRFTSARFQISDGGGPLLDHQGSLTADGATIQYSGSTGSQLLLVVTLETDATLDAMSQVVQERQVAQGVFGVSGAEVVLNGIDESGPLEWTGRYFVSNGEVTVLYPYDPCEAFATLTVDDAGDACEVKSERAFFDEADAAGNVLASALGEDPTQCSYDGGNILSNAPSDDLDALVDVCKEDLWQSASGSVCYLRNMEMHCVSIVWNKIAPAP